MELLRPSIKYGVLLGLLLLFCVLSPEMRRSGGSVGSQFADHGIGASPRPRGLLDDDDQKSNCSQVRSMSRSTDQCAFIEDGNCDDIKSQVSYVWLRYCHSELTAGFIYFILVRRFPLHK